MYYSYSYYAMKPKADMFHKYTRSASYTSTYTYENWQSSLEGYSGLVWQDFCKTFAEDPQFALLRGMTVVGIGVSDWSAVFRGVANQSGVFQGILRAYMAEIIDLDWNFFATRLAHERHSVHFPAVYPQWLFCYDYSQKQYLQDLAVYWDTIHDDYFKPWETTRIGDDSPEVLRLKYLGKMARQEIDAVAHYSAHQLDVFPNDLPLNTEWVDSFGYGSEEADDPFFKGVSDLFNSLEWVYLTHRYSDDSLGMMLRLLTLSGLNPTWWRRAIFHLIALNQEESHVLQLLAGESYLLLDGVQEIWDYANAAGAPLEEPPIQPTYLSMFYYTQEEYLTDFEEVYCAAPDDRYYMPWPDDRLWVLERPTINQGTLHHAVAIMGTTAGAIDWLVQKGSTDG